MISVVPYRAEYREALIELSLRAWEAVFPLMHQSVPNFVYECFYPAGWERRQADDVAFVLDAEPSGIDVALDGERPVGWVCTRMHPEDSMGEVYILAVDPPWRRRGIARRLIERAESRTRGLGMRMLMVETGGDPGHAPARATYEAVGFERWPVARYFKDLSGPSDAAQARQPSARADVP